MKFSNFKHREFAPENSAVAGPVFTSPESFSTHAWCVCNGDKCEGHNIALFYSCFRRVDPLYPNSFTDTNGGTSCPFLTSICCRTICENGRASWLNRTWFEQVQIRILITLHETGSKLLWWGRGFVFRRQLVRIPVIVLVWFCAYQRPVQKNSRKIPSNKSRLFPLKFLRTYHLSTTFEVL